ncbi:MAG TPA: hydroxyacylglutathione hydrolase [Rhodocyclaceae bacterium]|nr:hydroxyacylglutathione hydrolase [Rhodocyclaceae bacterium]
MEIVPLSAFRDNYIWTLVEEDRCIVVDPGDAVPVLRFLRERSLRLAAILITHRHNDHVGGIGELLAHFSVPVFGPLSEPIPHITHALVEGDIVRPPGLSCSFKVLEVPGHTEGHIAYYGEGILFCGDTLFAAGCGRLLGGTVEQLFESLQRLAALPPKTKVYCTHEYTLSNLRFARAAEPDNQEIAARQQHCEALRANNQITLPSTIGEELNSNPFLRWREATVRANAERAAGHKLDSGLAVFAATRAWKDQF